MRVSLSATRTRTRTKNNINEDALDLNDINMLSWSINYCALDQQLEERLNDRLDDKEGVLVAIVVLLPVALGGNLNQSLRFGKSSPN